ncbi:MAG: 50S ribosomal protein L17 [Planctomyces sp.]|nr:50S ribosomal protein L17 [Planctomyces sp.]
MRHKVAGRQLNRNASHRHAMFRNMSVSLILTVRSEGKEGEAKVPGRIITTLEKAKELRPHLEKLITLAKRAAVAEQAAAEFTTTAEKNSDAWREWRKSDKWQKWANAIAPAVALRRRAFAALRDKLALEILFDDIAPRYADRQGGYLRIARLADFRLGDAGRRALVEFVGDNDRLKRQRRAAPVVKSDTAPASTAPSVAASEPAAPEAPVAE